MLRLLILAVHFVQDPVSRGTMPSLGLVLGGCVRKVHLFRGCLAKLSGCRADLLGGVSFVLLQPSAVLFENLAQIILIHEAAAALLTITRTPSIVLRPVDCVGIEIRVSARRTRVDHDLSALFCFRGRGVASVRGLACAIENAIHGAGRFRESRRPPMPYLTRGSFHKCFFLARRATILNDFVLDVRQA